MAGKPVFRKSVNRWTPENPNYQYNNPTTRYAVSSQSKEDPSVHKYAHATVEHGYAMQPNFNSDGSPVDNRFTSSGWSASEPVVPEETLFHELSRPKIHYAYSDPSMRVHVPTLLAMAHKEHGKMEVSHSLSRHSSKLAQHGESLGVVTGTFDNPDMKVKNEEDFKPLTASTEHLDSTYPIKISDNDVSIAKGHLRTMLGRDKPRKQHMGPQFYQPEAEQPQLPGTEGV